VNSGINTRAKMRMKDPELARLLEQVWFGGTGVGHRVPQELKMS